MIGRHPTHPDDGFYLSPNYLLLGRTQNQTVLFPTNNGCILTRQNLVENVLDSFWKKWQKNFLPQMCFCKKWRDTHRNFEKDDVGLVEDQNTIRGCWKLGRIREVYPGRDGLVRGVEVEIVAKDGVKTCLSGPIQKLVFILPKDEQ